MSVFEEFWNWPFHIIVIYSFVLLGWWIFRPLDYAPASTAGRTTHLTKLANLYRRLVSLLTLLGETACRVDQTVMRCWSGITYLAAASAKCLSPFDNALAFLWRLPALVANILGRVTRSHKEEPHEPNASL